MVGPGAVRLAFPPESRLLSTIRLVVSVLARKTGLDDEGIEDLKVAVSETCAVAIGDLGKAGLQAPIELEIAPTPAAITVTVRDQAPDPDPARAGGPAGARAGVPPHPDMSEVDDRRLGLALVDALVEDLRCESLAGGGHRTSFTVPLPR